MCRHTLKGQRWDQRSKRDSWTKQGLEGGKKGWSKEVHTGEVVKNVEEYIGKLRETEKIEHLHLMDSI